MKHQKPDGEIFVERVNDQWAYAINDGPLVQTNNPTRVQWLAAKCDTVKRFAQMMKMED